MMSREKKAAHNRKYKMANKAKIAAASRKYYEANKAKIADRRRELYQANKEKKAASNRKYREEVAMNNPWEVGEVLLHARFEAQDCADSIGEIHYVVGNSKRNKYFVVNSDLFKPRGNSKIDFVAFPIMRR